MGAQHAMGSCRVAVVIPISPGKVRDKEPVVLSRSSVRRQTVPRKTTQKDKAGRDPRRHLDQSVDVAHRIVVIGDLHGMIHKARSLWRSLEERMGKPALEASLVVFLGDYCDRGLHTKDLLSWLITLQKERDRKGARTIFLLGNHEFCLLAFLGLLPSPKADPDFRFRATWDHDAGISGSRHERERWWAPQTSEDLPVLDDMHLQGRRWAGSWYEKSYGSASTFAAYGAEMGDRDSLIRNMPQEHQQFLADCPWVHIEDNPLLGRCVFVHAGLEADGTEDCEAQLQRLLARDARQQQPEPLFGRDGVLHTPPQLARMGTTVVSGHHGRVQLRAHRVILDNCSGDERNPLTALVLPDMLLIHHDGNVEPRDVGAVFTMCLKAKCEAQVAATRAAALGDVRKNSGHRNSGSAGHSSPGSQSEERQPFPQGDQNPLEE